MKRTMTASSTVSTGASRRRLKRGKAAWSKLEDVLAEKRLQKALKDVYDDV